MTIFYDNILDWDDKHFVNVRIEGVDADNRELSDLGKQNKLFRKQHKLTKSKILEDNLRRGKNNLCVVRYMYK